MKDKRGKANKQPPSSAKAIPSGYKSSSHRLTGSAYDENDKSPSANNLDEAFLLTLLYSATQKKARYVQLWDECTPEHENHY